MTRWTAFFLSGPWLEESQASFYSSLSSFFGCGKEETDKMALQLLVFYAQTILVRPYSQDKRQQKKLIWFLTIPNVPVWTIVKKEFILHSHHYQKLMFLISLLNGIAGVLLSSLKLFERGKVLLVRLAVEPTTVAPSQNKIARSRWKHFIVGRIWLIRYTLWLSVWWHHRRLNFVCTAVLSFKILDYCVQGDRGK